MYSFDLNGDTEVLPGTRNAESGIRCLRQEVRSDQSGEHQLPPPDADPGGIGAQRGTRGSALCWAAVRRGFVRPRRMIADGNSLAAISKARMEARERALAAGESWSEGSFDPDEIPDIVVDKRPNIDPFMDDPESYRLRSIEHYDESTGEAEKGIVFERNVLALEKEPEIKSAGDALFHVLDRIGYPDIDAIADAAGLSVSQTLEELGDALFEVPGKPGVYETRDDYLSGNVRDKLRVARDAAARTPGTGAMSRLWNSPSRLTCRRP